MAIRPQGCRRFAPRPSSTNMKTIFPGAEEPNLSIMKKLLLLVAAVAFFASNAAAQNFEKNIFGVRGGLNIANVRFDGISPDSKIGVHIGGSYERLLASFPLYFETGLQLTWKGCQVDAEGFTNKMNAAYLEIPIMVNYKFNIQDKVTLYPSAGFYYGLGIGGKIKTIEGKADTFGDMTCQRSDFGLRFAGTALWRQYTFTMGYEFSITDISQLSEKIKPNNFFISIGYNF